MAESRIAELAVEMMGAQFAQKLLTDVWEAAAPEVKQKLANDILQRAVNYGVPDALHKEIMSLASAALKVSGPALIEAAIRKAVVASVENSHSVKEDVRTILQRQAHTMINQMVSEAVKPLEAEKRATLAEHLATKVKI